MSSTKKKVLFILHIPPPINGAAMVGQFIMKSKIINETFDADYINLTASFHLNSIGKGGFDKIITILKILKKVLTALLKKDYDLCYMTLTAKGAGFYKDFLIVVLLKLFRRNIVYHFHNKGVQKSSSKTFNDLLYRLAFKNTNSIVLAPALSKDIEKYVDKNNIYVCANGIPDINEIGDRTTEHPKQDGVCRFLFLSNMMKEKGVVELLKACKQLKEKNLLFGCHFIGAWSDVTQEEFFDTVHNLGITEQVFAHGKKYGDEKLQFFEQSDVFVFPTYYHNECFPLVLLEAMQHSLPIISTPEGGIGDLVLTGKTGFLLNQRDVKALADTLHILIEDQELRIKMGKAGRKRYEQHFTLPIFENRLCTILTDISEPT